MSLKKHGMSDHVRVSFALCCVPVVAIGTGIDSDHDLGLGQIGVKALRAWFAVLTDGRFSTRLG